MGWGLAVCDYLSDGLSAFFCLFWAAAKNSYDEILTGLAKPVGGAEFGKYYSLPALSDPRIGECFDAFQYCWTPRSTIWCWMCVFFCLIVSS